MPQLRLLTVLLMLCMIPLSGVQATPEPPAQTPGNLAPTAPSWPQVLAAGDTKLTIYQPQLDSWDGYTLHARAAVEATSTDGKATYGIVQFSAHTLVDKATRWVALDQYTITKADFPDSATKADSWVAAVKQDLSLIHI